ncbi:MAG: N-acetylmuramoyl-L-alanine amidase [Rhodospirillales bacterium]
MKALSIAETPSPNFDSREGTPVDMLVLHYTGMQSAEAALARLCDPEAKVSAHYIINEDGAVCRMVDETMRAWHAGVAFWRGHTNINARSVGVELVNPGHEFGYRAFPEAQMEACRALCLDILTRHPIPARNVIGHSDAAPRRKTDPGEYFDWPGFAAAGIGLWPEPDAGPIDQNEDAARGLLTEAGYETEDMAAALKAFQRHFRPAQVNGRIDAETMRILRGLAAACRAEAPSGT